MTLCTYACDCIRDRLNVVTDANLMVLLCNLDCDGTQLHAPLPPQVVYV